MIMVHNWPIYHYLPTYLFICWSIHQAIYLPTDQPICLPIYQGKKTYPSTYQTISMSISTTTSISIDRSIYIERCIFWLVVYLPLWKIMEFVSWDDYSIPNMMGKS